MKPLEETKYQKVRFKYLLAKPSIRYTKGFTGQMDIYTRPKNRLRYWTI